MITIAAAVEEIIRHSPLVEEALTKGIINYSALAREISPQLEKQLLKPIQRGSIIMALKRIRGKLQKKQKAFQAVYSMADLTVRSKLIEFTFANSDTIPERQKKLFLITEKQRDIFCNFSQGVRETTIIISEELERGLEYIFQSEKLISKRKNLSSITIRFHKKIIDTPGVYYTILKLIALEGISVVEIVSTSMELTIVFNTVDIDHAFSLLQPIS